MSIEPRIGPHGRDDDLTRALRSAYAAPSDDAYWSSLAGRIMARISGETAVEQWWQPLARFARIGLVAAAVALVAARIALSRDAARETAIAYDGVIETPQSAPLQLATDATPGSVRDATLRYVISP
ncbi:MAG TPA: hypothetical protein VN607_00930 [Gemmatimonadaceae bacterium]|nr:hypothetical protein [Gemmatimonadaceae bacterium]